jgi:hypothetical protein
MPSGTSGAAILDTPLEEVRSGRLNRCPKQQFMKYELTLEGVSLGAGLQRRLTARMRRSYTTMPSEDSANYIPCAIFLLQIADSSNAVLENFDDRAYRCTVRRVAQLCLVAERRQ